MNRIYRFWTEEKLLGFGLIILAILAGHLIRQYATLYTAPFYVVLIIIANIAGLRMSILAATLFSIGTYLEWYESSHTQFWLNVISLYATAWIVGGLKRKARIIDTLNGNLDILWHIVREVDYLVIHWHTLSDKTKYLRVLEIKGMAVDLTTNVLGWKKIAEARESVEAMRNADDITTKELTNES